MQKKRLREISIFFILSFLFFKYNLIKRDNPGGI